MQCQRQRGGGKNAYGIMSRPGDSTGQLPFYAHRVAYALANGINPEELPDDMEVRHVVCDNPPCCNPRHLALGTSSDNKQDAIEKGRMHWQTTERNEMGQFTPKSKP